MEQELYLKLCGRSFRVVNDHLNGRPRKRFVQEIISFSDNETELGTEYLRQCESMAYTQSVLQQKLAMHGTLNVSIVKTQCDFDGSYGTYTINNNM